MRPRVVRLGLDGGRLALFAPSTGRWVIAVGDDEAAAQARLVSSGGIADDDDARLALVPHPHPRVLALPDRPALWAPIPSRPTPGGHAYRALPLDPDGLALWRAFNGARALGAAADRAGVTRRDALRLAAGWTDPEVQAVQLWPAGSRPRDPLGLCGPTLPDAPPSPSHRDDRGGTTLGAYHHGIAADGVDRRFDDVETTVAHVWAEPNGALGGEVYGVRLRERLRAAGADVDGLVVEVGPGTGSVAAAFAGAGVGPYLRIDRSPALLALQAARAPSTFGVVGDAVALPLRDRSVPVLVCNEVIADLRAVPAGAGDPEVVARRARYALPPAQPGGYDNVGAWQLVEELGRVLAHGGVAIVTEFGDVDGAPAVAGRLDHPEVSIAFGALARVAAGVGLVAEVHRLDDWLGVDLGARQLARHAWVAVRALAPDLRARPWTRATLAAALPERVEGLSWVSVAEPGVGPLVTRFHALVLRAPTPTPP